MMLMKQDYDPMKKAFQVQRGISGGEEVVYTKDKKIHEVPLVSEFVKILEGMVTVYPFSSFVFTCKESKHPHKRYTKDIISRLWNDACKAVGVKINLYSGTKHSTVTKMMKQYSPEQVKIATGHASIQSVYRYGKVEIEDKRALLEGKVFDLKTRERSANVSKKKITK